MSAERGFYGFDLFSSCPFFSPGAQTNGLDFQRQTVQTTNAITNAQAQALLQQVKSVSLSLSGLLSLLLFSTLHFSSSLSLFLSLSLTKAH